ncbi:MAG: hypothetical protein WBG76_14350 [Ornithinimicrobium sp.]
MSMNREDEDEPVTSAFPDEVLTAADPASGLEGTLTLEREADDGVSRLTVELRNPTPQQIPLKINTESSAFLMVSATDDRGHQLSKTPRKFATDEQQRFESVTLQPGARQSWTTPLRKWIPPDRISDPEGLSGRLVVNIALLLTTSRGEERSMLTLYDTNVRFTRHAIEIAS